MKGRFLQDRALPARMMCVPQERPWKAEVREEPPPATPCIGTHAHTYSHIQAHVHTRVHLHTHAYTHSYHLCTHTQAYTHVLTLKCACTWLCTITALHTHIRTRGAMHTRVCIATLTHTHTRNKYRYAHTCMLTCSHTHMCTYTRCPHSHTHAVSFSGVLTLRENTIEPRAVKGSFILIIKTAATYSRAVHNAT